MSERIYICPLSALGDMLLKTGATHLISLLNSDIMIETPDLVDPDNHLKLIMSDISEPMDGRITPEREHIEQLIAFAKNWDQNTPLLVHCLAGISRSTAATFIALCTLNPDLPEFRIAQALREASATAQPNRLLIEHGDAILGRDSKMINAIKNMGPGSLAPEGKPFSLPSKIQSR